MRLFVSELGSDEYHQVDDGLIKDMVCRMKEREILVTIDLFEYEDDCEALNIIRQSLPSAIDVLVKDDKTDDVFVSSTCDIEQYSLVEEHANSPKIEILFGERSQYEVK